MTEQLPGWFVELATLCGVVLLLAVAAALLVAAVTWIVIGGAGLLRFLRTTKDSP